MALGRWAVRVLVVGGLVATLWFAGPRAWRIASARFALDVQDSVVVPLDRLGAVATPPWVDGPILRAVLEDLEPREGPHDGSSSCRRGPDGDEVELGPHDATRVLLRRRSAWEHRGRIAVRLESDVRHLSSRTTRRMGPVR